MKALNKRSVSTQPATATARTAMARTTLLRTAMVTLACVLALGGCTTVKGWFGGKSSKELKPAELTQIVPTVQVAKLWSVSAGKGEGHLGTRQGPTIADGHVYAAAIEGGVSALDLRTGQSIWRYASELPLSSSPGAGDGLVVVGSLEGDVIALDAATGTEKWKAKVGTEVVAAPAIGQGLVLVHSNDGRVTAFDATTGERRWFWSHETPTLSVRGDSSPLLGPGFAFIGNDDGTLTALTLSNGREVWEQTVAAAEGRSELDRMADIDGTPVLEDTTLYATSYKKKTMAIDGPSGRPLWSHDSGGPGKVAVSSDRVVVSDPGGVVWGLDKSTGSALWQQDALLRRDLSAPAIQGDYAVVGDYKGVLHWLNLSDGAFAARMETGDAVRATPASSDGILVVQTVKGELSAYQLQ